MGMLWITPEHNHTLLCYHIAYVQKHFSNHILQNGENYFNHLFRIVRSARDLWSPVWNNVSPIPRALRHWGLAQLGITTILEYHSNSSVVIQFIGILLTFRFLVIKRKKIANKGIRSAIYHHCPTCCGNALYYRVCVG